VFEVCEKKEFFIQLFERCLKGKLLEYSEDTIANYVIQHFIQCIPTKEVAKEVFEELSPVLLIFLSKGKQGIIWHLVELCVKFEIKQKELYELLFDAIQKQEEKKPKAVQKDFVPALLNLQLSTSSSKLTLNVTGARIIENLMKFKVSIVQKNVLQSLFKLNTLQLIALAKDSIGSRCIIEPIWETNEPALKWAQKNLYERFVGHFGNLALDRIGAFSVMKCYEKLELKQKAIVAEELLKVEKKLAGSHFSQLVLNTCHVYEFRNNREKWEALYCKLYKL
jgi:nucleolar protein 9